MCDGVRPRAKSERRHIGKILGTFSTTRQTTCALHLTGLDAETDVDTDENKRGAKRCAASDVSARPINIRMFWGAQCQVCLISMSMSVHPNLTPCR